MFISIIAGEEEDEVRGGFLLLSPPEQICALRSAAIVSQSEWL